MRLEKEFVIAQPREVCSKALEDDATYTSLFPDTEITSSSGGVRETLTHYSALGQTRQIRFVFRTEGPGKLRFEKICDGNVWRSLQGELRLEPLGKSKTRVVLSMEGRTRALVPELTIRVPMREQFEQMSRSLRARLSEV
jgi:hypothetical protein